jgi:methylenetetrahydrofolate reductase (NADPH)
VAEITSDHYYSSTTVAFMDDCSYSWRMRISIELVPRDRDTIVSEATWIRKHLTKVKTVNIPDLMRFDLRSWGACDLLSGLIPNRIPHLRAIDMPFRQELPMLEALQGLKEVVAIRGDRPQDMSRVVYPTTTIDLIRKLKKQAPHLKVYAAFDPYRQGFRDEMEYALRKLDEGVDGFFTQPIFDLRLLEICAEVLVPHTVFWGIAPVTGERSRAYWETTNRVIFPSDFVSDLKWNRTFARDALALIKRLGSNVYFMPIRVNLSEYLSGILE